MVEGNSFWGSKDGAVVEHLPPVQASHQCGLGSIPGFGVKYGLSLLLVLVLAPRGFSPGTPVFPSPQNQHFQIPSRSGIRGPQVCQSYCLSVVLLSVTLVKESLFIYSSFILTIRFLSSYISILRYNDNTV